MSENALEQAQELPHDSVGDRASMMIERMRAETGGAADAETTEPSDHPTLPSASPEALSTDPIAERNKRLGEIRARAIEDQQKRARHAAQAQERTAAEQAKREAEEAKGERAELAALKAKMATPEGFLSLYAEHGGKVDAIAEYVSKSLNDPSLLAEERLKAAISPELEQHRKELAALKKEREDEIKAKMDADERRAHAEGVRRFIEHTNTVQGDAPLSARYLAVKGAEQYGAFADLMYRQHQPRSFQELQDLVESQLEELRQVYVPDSGLQAKPSPQARNHAAAQATTLSNRAAQQRSSVVEEAENWQLDVGDRAEQLKRKLSPR